MDGVSVIVPCYNGEKYLTHCLESILRQTHGGPLEVLLGDDGSSDRSAAIAASFGAVVQVLRHPGGANRGVAATRNLCIRAAQHPLIALLDADDIWLPGHLAALAGALAADPAAGMAYANGSYMSADGRDLHVGFTYPPPLDPPTMLANCCVFPSGVVIRRRIFDQVGMFDETLRYCEDYDMWLRIFENFPVIHVPVDGYLYRRHAAQISLSVDELCRYAAQVVRRAQARYPYEKALVRSRYAVFAFRRAQAALRRKSYLRGLYHLGRAAFYDPRRAAGEVVQRALGRGASECSPHAPREGAPSRGA
jgi:glycosyltransferase involved in cell wall biosynthesis